MINILDVKPHVVSKDIKGYSFLIYGAPKVGKTTFSTRSSKNLLLATEIGYKALPGVMALPIHSWAEFLQVLTQLRDEKKKQETAELKGENYELHFDCVVVDVVDILYDLCEKYILAREGVDKVADVPYGAGYSMVKNEFDEKLRSVVQMGYGLILISHEQVLTNAEDENIKYSSCTLNKAAKNIVTRLVDIYGYADIEETDDGLVHILHTRATSRYEAGARFKYIEDPLPLDYNAVAKAIAVAIDKEAAEIGTDAYKTERFINSDEPAQAPDYDAVKASIDSSIKTLMEQDENSSTKIAAIVKNRLGADRRLADATPTQIEQLVMVDSDLKGLIEENA